MKIHPERVAPTRHLLADNATMLTTVPPVICNKSYQICNNDRLFPQLETRPRKRGPSPNSQQIHKNVKSPSSIIVCFPLLCIIKSSLDLSVEKYTVHIGLLASLIQHRWPHRRQYERFIRVFHLKNRTEEKKEHILTSTKWGRCVTEGNTATPASQTPSIARER